LDKNLNGNLFLNNHTQTFILVNKIEGYQL
jgi:hypothetical protein